MADHAIKNFMDTLLEHQNRQLRKDKGELVECVSCGQDHEAIPKLYIGRERYACSDDCWDEWVNFGRFARPE